MKVPYSWMAEYCDPGLDPEDLAEKMAMTGTEVERVLRTGPEDTTNFVIGLVTGAEPHPDADRLSVCRVDTGDGVRTIVCGAPNVAAGQTVVAALPGARMPDGTRIREAELRGVASEGMICSESELGLGAESDGILVLEDGIAVPGSPAADAVGLDEVVLELEVTPNRTDCFSIYGVAREAHAITGADLGSPPWADGEIDRGGAAAGVISVTVEDPDLCPRFTARAFTGVKVGPSPGWLRSRLAAAGQRAINNVVDITNYVMLLTGQPLHAFDLDLVPGGALSVRPATQGERVTTLDGVERELDDGMLLVCDRDGPAAIAGVMGGTAAEVSDETTSVLLEAATWNGPDILKTSRELNLRSEASARFEKQLHPALAGRAQVVASQLLVELCGATAVDGMVDVAAELPDPEPIRLRAGRVERILGMEIDRDDQVESLVRLGFAVEADGEDLLVTVPPDRYFDVTREIDLVEEVGRIHDLDRLLPATLPAGSGRVGGLSRQQSLQRRAEDSLREAGLDEIVGWSFTDPGENPKLRLAVPDPRALPVSLSNPLSEDQSVMRTILLGSLLGAAQRNLSRGADRVALFESGRVYLPAAGVGPGPLGGAFPGIRRPPANEPHHLAALVCGPLDPPSWADSSPPDDFFALKGVLERLGSGLGMNVQVGPGDQPFLHPGRSGLVLVDDREIGWIGEVHPAVASQWDLGSCLAFEIALADLLAASPLGRETYSDFTPFPHVDRDLAVVVGERLSAAEISAAVDSAGGDLLVDTKIFDVYRGEGIGADEKSVALRLRFRAPDRTLDDAQVDPVLADVLAALESLGGRLRG